MRKFSNCLADSTGWDLNVVCAKVLFTEFIVKKRSSTGLCRTSVPQNVP
jgi:hypothetical protein